MKKILVTGGRGFIGSHLVDKLLKDKNNEVFVLDIKDGAEMDIRNVPLHFHDIHFDIIYHLGALISVEESYKKAKEYFDTNVFGTWNVANCMDRRRFINISSIASLYRNSPYADTKFLSEFTGLMNDNNFVNIRLTNVFGERCSCTSAVIPNFINNVLRGEQPIIHGTGNQRRDFMYVEDIVEKIILYSGEPYRQVILQSGLTISIKSLCEKICDLMGVDFNPIYTEGRTSEVSLPDCNANISDYENVSFNFERGLLNTIKHYKEQHEQSLGNSLAD